MDIRVPFNILLNFPHILKIVKSCQHWIHQFSSSEKKKWYPFQTIGIKYDDKITVDHAEQAFQAFSIARRLPRTHSEGEHSCAPAWVKDYYLRGYSLLREGEKKGLPLSQEGISPDLPEEIVELAPKCACATSFCDQLESLSTLKFKFIYCFKGSTSVLSWGAGEREEKHFVVLFPFLKHHKCYP